MKKNLQGLTILVTRPKPAGEALSAALTAEGADCFLLPALAFGPPDDTALFASRLQELPLLDWLIFISPQAVKASSAAIHEQWPTLPPNLKIAAVGAGTAHALSAAHFRAALYPLDHWNTEGLLALPAFQEVHNQRIGLMKGEGGRETLAQTLTARGATVIPIIAYQRLLPVVDVRAYLQMLHENKLQVVICTSVESIKNVKHLLSAAWPALRKVGMVVISERMREYAADAGFEQILLASNASHDAIIEVLKREHR
jgi:uroporphyrinogen-III synthase